LTAVVLRFSGTVMDATSSFRWKRAHAEIAAAALILAWRAAAVTPAGLRSDWLALLGAFWILAVLSEGSRARSWITVGGMAALLAIYLSGQLPAAAAFLRAVL
jgi:hypothetical protein